MVVSAGGCSASASGEYYRIRGIAVAPQPGEGVTISAQDPTLFRGINGTGAAVAFGQQRGTMSDQPSSAE